MTNPNSRGIIVGNRKGGTAMRSEQDGFLEKLFRSSYNELELYANALLKNHSDAETAVQDSFHTACNKIDDITAFPFKLESILLSGTRKRYQQEKRHQK